MAKSSALTLFVQLVKHVPERIIADAVAKRQTDYRSKGVRQGEAVSALPDVGLHAFLGYLFFFALKAAMALAISAGSVISIGSIISLASSGVISPISTTAWATATPCASQ